MVASAERGQIKRVRTGAGKSINKGSIVVEGVFWDSLQNEFDELVAKDQNDESILPSVRKVLGALVWEAKSPCRGVIKELTAKSPGDIIKPLHLLYTIECSSVTSQDEDEGGEK